VDHLFETIFPGYRTASMLDERGHFSRTPFGDAADTLLSDVLLSVLARYDTVVASHRLVTEPQETRRKLENFVRRDGGTLYITAPTVHDLGSTLLDVTVSTSCVRMAHTGQNTALCPLVVDASTKDRVVVSNQIMIGGQLAAAELEYKASGGVLKIVGVDNYGMAARAWPTSSMQAGATSAPTIASMKAS
jgi:hypothetical protein